MDDLLPRRKIGIVRAIRVEEPLDTPLGQQEQEEEASSSSLSNAKSSVVTPEDSPREEAESKLKLEKKRLRKQTISSHRKDNQDKQKSLNQRLEELSSTKRKERRIILDALSSPAPSPRITIDGDETSTTAELCSIEVPVFQKGAATERKVSLPTTPVAPPYYSAPVTTRRQSDHLKLPPCPRCQKGKHVVLLGYWKERQQAVYYCGNEIPLHEVLKQEEEKKDKTNYGYEFDPIEEGEAPVFETSHKKRNRLFSLFRSTPPSSSAAKTKPIRKTSKSKSDNYEEDSFSEVLSKNDIIVCGRIWMPNMMYHHIERIIMQYSHSEKKMVISHFE